MKPPYYLLLICFTVVLFNCKRTTEVYDPVIHLLDIDDEFSKMSETEGMKKAFLEYASEDAVLLRPNSDPIIGKNAIREYLKDIDDRQFTLTWKPMRAYASKSHDMGYTFGVYTFKQDSLITKGTYTSYWVLTQEGWKYSLDTGNPGLSPKETTGE